MLHPKKLLFDILHKITVMKLETSCTADGEKNNLLNFFTFIHNNKFHKAVYPVNVGVNQRHIVIAHDHIAEG